MKKILDQCPIYKMYSRAFWKHRLRAFLLSYLEFCISEEVRREVEVTNCFVTEGIEIILAWFLPARKVLSVVAVMCILSPFRRHEHVRISGSGWLADASLDVFFGSSISSISVVTACSHCKWRDFPNAHHSTAVSSVPFFVIKNISENWKKKRKYKVWKLHLRGSSTSSKPVLVWLVTGTRS